MATRRLNLHHAQVAEEVLKNMYERAQAQVILNSVSLTASRCLASNPMA